MRILSQDQVNKAYVYKDRIALTQGRDSLDLQVLINKYNNYKYSYAHDLLQRVKKNLVLDHRIILH